ncbi:MAG: glucose 1-dehydrogenase [Terriglobia bacterium]|jgi:NAD(P)-dependent dehydrogenase (short-subunit alcohol dehydrogenase family)
MRLKDKVAIVTGGGTGIGKAISLRFAQEGAKVVAAGLDLPPLEEVVRQIEAAGGEGLALRCDLRIVEDTRRVVDEALKRFSTLHILVNNAAMVDLNRTIQEMTVEEWDGCLNASLRSVFLMTKWSAPAIRQAGGGAIINLGSVGAVMPWAEGGAYCASKGGVITLTKVMAIEYGPWKIRVNAISPGAVMTPNLQRAIEHFRHEDKLNAKSVLHRVGQPEEIANAAVFLASDEASYVTSANLFVDGGYLIT